jgi:hypothetical protein
MIKLMRRKSRSESEGGEGDTYTFQDCLQAPAPVRVIPHDIAGGVTHKAYDIVDDVRGNRAEGYDIVESLARTHLYLDCRHLLNDDRGFPLHTSLFERVRLDAVVWERVIHEIGSNEDD